MRMLFKSEIDISRIELKALFWLSLKQDFISLFHSFLYFIMQVSGFHNNFLSTTNRTFLFSCMTRSLALFTFHLYFFHSIFNFNFSNHFSSSSASRACMKSTCRISCTFAMFANLSSPETIYSLPTCVKRW